MLTEKIAEARRQIEICNACRYCEGYCSVFPAIHRQRTFADGDITQFASLCHNCRACYYACQYTEPHEFDVNLPRALAEMRQESWKAHAWPAALARLLERSGMVISATLVLLIAFLFWLAAALRPASGEGFYAYMSHGLMVAIFVPAFLLPACAIVISLKRYWQTIGGGRMSVGALLEVLRATVHMKNLAGGHGDGCNFEGEDRFSNTRRWFHQATLYGFVLCFAATSAGTVLHYGFGLEAPYPLFSIPKLLGVPGGLLLCGGTAGLAWLKTKADPNLGAPSAWGSEMVFIWLLFGVSASGLILYATSGSVAEPVLLWLHLGAVLTFFLLTPYSKMVHGFYHLAALMQEAVRSNASGAK